MSGRGRVPGRARGPAEVGVGPRPRPGERGLSLLELMLAMSILATVLVAFISTATTVMQLFHHQRHMTQAIAVADMTTEELLLLDASDDALTGGLHSRLYDRTGRPATASTAFFTARWTVSAYDPVPGIRRLAVEVRWTEHGVNRHIAWTTYRN